MKVQLNNDISKNTFRLIYIFTLVISLLLIYVSFRGIIKVDILKQATKIDAVVTNNLTTPKTTAKKQGPKLYRVEFKYTIDSNEYIGVDDLGDKIFKYKIGEKIKIYYNNEDIKDVKVYRVSAIPLVIGVLLLALMTFVLIKSEKRQPTN